MDTITNSNTRKHHTQLRIILFSLVCTFSIAFECTTLARPFRVGQIPNSASFGCYTCHVTPGGPRNPFGKQVEAITGSANKPFWDAILAAKDADGDGFSNGEELGDPDGDGEPTAGAKVTNPGDAKSKPVITVLPITLSAPTLSKETMLVGLKWSGGNGTYLVQSVNTISDTNWFDLLTTQNTNVSLSLNGTARFFRVQNNVQKTVLPLSVMLQGETPDPDGQEGKGYGVLSLEGNTLSYRIEFSQLQSTATAAHIHGPASPTNTAPPLYSLDGATGQQGVLSGKVVVTDVDKATILDGKTYVNIHTTGQPNGEIRGQILPSP